MNNDTTGIYTLFNNEKQYVIDIDKIKTIDDIKYLMLSFFNMKNGRYLYMSEKCPYFNKLKHLIKEEP